MEKDKLTEKKELEFESFQTEDFTQEEIDEIERNILAEFEMKVENTDFNPECFDYVHVSYAAMLEERLAYYERRLECV